MMSTPPDARSPVPGPVSSETAEDEGLLCIGCGYDLRELAADGSCPECGTPIARSLAGHRLGGADRTWVARIVRGQRLATIGLAAVMVGVLTVFIGMLLGGLVASILQLDWLLAAVEILRTVIFTTAVLGGLVLAGVGAVLVTSQDPRDTEREPAISARSLARWGLFATIGLLAFGEFGPAGIPAMPQLVAGIATIVGLAAFTVAIVALLEHLGALAARIPNQVLAETVRRHARSLRVVLGAIVVIMLVQVSGAADLLPDSVAQVISSALLLGMGILSILLLVTMASVHGTMRWLSRAFAAARDESAPAS